MLKLFMFIILTLITGFFHIPTNVLNNIFSRQNLQKLNLSTTDMIELIPQQNVTELKTLEIDFIDSPTFDYTCLENALKKMPSLIKLSLNTSEANEISNIVLFTMIEQIVAINKHLIIKPLFIIGQIEKIEIRLIENETQISLSKSKKFELFLNANVLDIIPEVIRDIDFFLVNCEIIVEEIDNLINFVDDLTLLDIDLFID